MLQGTYLNFLFCVRKDPVFYVVHADRLASMFSLSACQVCGACLALLRHWPKPLAVFIVLLYVT